MTDALEFEAREVFDAVYTEAYAARRPIGYDDEGQAHHEAVQEAVEAVVVFVTERVQGQSLRAAA
jgi:hypothetical protein